MKEKERMLAGQLYLSSDTQLTRDRRRTQKILRRFNKLIPAQTAKREKIIRKLLRNVGIACSVYPPFYCDYGYNIEIGDYFFANRNCTILDVGTVAIGNHVMLGPGVMIVTAHHPIDPTLRNKGYGLGTEIRIDDNVWIGAHVIITPGVQIGCNTIIGAGSVVTHSIPSNVIAAGNPCKIIRSIIDCHSIQKKEELK